MRYTISGTYDGEILKNYLYKDLGLSHSAVTYLKNQEIEKSKNFPKNWLRQKTTHIRPIIQLENHV